MGDFLVLLYFVDTWMLIGRVWFTFGDCLLGSLNEMVIWWIVVGDEVESAAC